MTKTWQNQKSNPALHSSQSEATLCKRNNAPTAGQNTLGALTHHPLFDKPSEFHIRKNRSNQPEYWVIPIVFNRHRRRHDPCDCILWESLRHPSFAVISVAYVNFHDEHQPTGATSAIPTRVLGAGIDCHPGNRIRYLSVCDHRDYEGPRCD